MVPLSKHRLEGKGCENRQRPQRSVVVVGGGGLSVGMKVLCVAVTIAVISSLASAEPGVGGKRLGALHHYHNKASVTPHDIINPGIIDAPRSRSRAPSFPLPTGVPLRPKFDLKERIRELLHQQRQRNAPGSNHEEVIQQVREKLQREAETGPLSRRGSSPLPQHTSQKEYIKNIIREYTIKQKRPFPRPARQEGQQTPQQVKEDVQERDKAGVTTTIEPDAKICDTDACKEAGARISESLNRTVDPCDNFYDYACGGWIASHELDESGWNSTFGQAQELMDSRLLEILESDADPEAALPLQQIRMFFSTCMDTDALDQVGMDPVVDQLAGQGGWPMTMDDWDPDNFDLATAINNARSLNVYPLVQVYTDLDFYNTSRWLLYVNIGQVPIGWYNMIGASEEDLEPYHTFMATAAKLVRDSLGSSVTDQDIEDQVDEVIAFEIKYAQIINRTEYEVTDTAWLTTLTEIQAETDAGTPGQFDWLSFVQQIFEETDVTFSAEETVLSFKGPFFTDLSNLLAETDPTTLANAVGWWWPYDMQRETTYAMRNATLKFQQDFYGITELSPRRDHCLQMTNGNLGFALSREYIDLYVADTVKPEVTALVEDLRSSFSTLLANNTWMEQEDIDEAQEKLAAIDPFVAYPDWIMDDDTLTQGYEGLEIVEGDLVLSLTYIGDWYDFNNLKDYRDVPQDTFVYQPTIVNAMYMPEYNSITIFVGILQIPFYEHGAIAALNYGAIGMIIGHEMTHGFDNNGRLFDKDGNYVQWWSNATVEAFNNHAVCFVDQYDQYVPPELEGTGIDASVNGLQTLGENIADNGGIREAFRAYQAYVARNGEEQRLPGLEEFTPEQVFYLGNANQWCEKKTPEVTIKLLFGDVHSPGRFRVLGPLSNDAEFSRVWQCPVGSPMNKGDDRCLLW